MSVRLKPELPERLFALMDGERLEQKLGRVLLLITIDENGWPYTAMLGYLEVVAADRNNIRIAPWNNSTTSANMRRNSKVTMLAVDEAMAYYIQGTAIELSRDLQGFPGMAKINIRIDSVLEDNALDYEGSARITTGIRFESPQMDAAYLNRAKQILAALQQ